MTLGWPAALLIMFLVFVAAIAFSSPRRRHHEIEMTQIKSTQDAQYEALAADYTKLAEETHAVQTAMQSDLAAVRTSVESIEQMMRDVG